MKRKRAKRDHQTRERVTSSFFFFSTITTPLLSNRHSPKNDETTQKQLNHSENRNQLELESRFQTFSWVHGYPITRIQFKSNFFSKSFFAKMCIHERQDSKKNLSWESRSPTRSYAKQSSSTMTIGKERNWIGLFISFILMVTGLSACIIQTKYQLRFFPSVLLLLAYV